MIGLESWIAFAAATALFAYMPGPALLYTAGQTVARGRRAGFWSAFGIHLGGYAHVLAAALGLAVLFEAVPSLYLAVKLAGAAYLVWLGLAMLLQRDRADPHAPPASRTAKRAFLQSVTVEVLNPKTALFFVAFLPQFVEPSGGVPVWAQFLILGTIVNLAFSSADLVAVWLADALVARFKRSTTGQRIARAVGGSVLVGLGVKLAADGR